MANTKTVWTLCLSYGNLIDEYPELCRVDYSSEEDANKALEGVVAKIKRDNVSGCNISGTFLTDAYIVCKKIIDKTSFLEGTRREDVKEGRNPFKLKGEN